MNAEQHLQYAQQLLGATAATPDVPSSSIAPDTAALAQAHALCAVAIELGVPIAAEAPETQATP